MSKIHIVRQEYLIEIILNTIESIFTYIYKLILNIVFCSNSKMISNILIVFKNGGYLCN